MFDPEAIDTDDDARSRLRAAMSAATNIAIGDHARGRRPSLERLTQEVEYVFIGETSAVRMSALLAYLSTRYRLDGAALAGVNKPDAKSA